MFFCIIVRFVCVSAAVDSPPRTYINDMSHHFHNHVLLSSPRILSTLFFVDTRSTAIHYYTSTSASSRSAYMQLIWTFHIQNAQRIPLHWKSPFSVAKHENNWMIDSWVMTAKAWRWWIEYICICVLSSWRWCRCTASLPAWLFHPHQARCSWFM